MFSSVRSNSFCKSLISKRRFLSFTSHSRDSMSFVRYELRASWRSSSADMAADVHTVHYSWRGRVFLYRLCGLGDDFEKARRGGGVTSCRHSLVVVVVMGVDYGSESLPHSLEPWSFLQGSVENRNHSPTPSHFS
jgi:hypothetical protein